MNKEEKLMNDLCDKYGTDKGTNKEQLGIGPIMHNYTKVYAELFYKFKDADINLFECGLGTNNVNIPSNMGADGKPGASLRLWRDYFLNAKIYGADIDGDILFQEERIFTGQMDQLDNESINNYFEKFDNFIPTIVIDDGLHEYEAAVSLYNNVFKRLRDDGVYIIEDVDPEMLDKLNLYFLNQPDVDIDVRQYIDGNTRIDNTLFIVRKKVKD